jgi:SAM-dependent methyltransferase
MSEVTHVTACRLCDGALELVVSFTPTPPGDQYITAERWQEHQPCYPLDLMICRACGAVQLADTVDPKLIYPEYLYTTSVSRGLDEHFRAYADSVLDRVKPLGNTLVLDIGSNDGTLLRQFATYGCCVLGVDPAAAIAAQATAAGIHTHHAFFSAEVARELRAQHGYAEIITANHVMANVADLHDFIEGVKLLLAPNGTFVFETGYWPSIVEKNLIDTIEHEHIHYFAVRPLERFFAAHGLQLFHAEIQPTKGGSLRGYVRHAGNGITATMSDLIVRELDRGYLVASGLKGWTAGLQDIEANMRTQIAQTFGERWIGYGAAVGSTLLLHQFGLGEKLTCLVDANPAKQGRLSPGYRLPVHDPSRLAELQPDCIVILAWRYAELIQAQHPEFKGKWLIPLPELVAA